MSGGWDQFVEEERAKCRDRRDRVLAHPDIAKRLCERPLSLSTPEVWSGYVPPYMWRDQVNNSPVRAQLMEILHAVAEREKQAEKED